MTSHKLIPFLLKDMCHDSMESQTGNCLSLSYYRIMINTSHASGGGDRIGLGCVCVCIWGWGYWFPRTTLCTTRWVHGKGTYRTPSNEFRAHRLHALRDVGGVSMLGRFQYLGDLIRLNISSKYAEICEVNVIMILFTLFVMLCHNQFTVHMLRNALKKTLTSRI